MTDDPRLQPAPEMRLRELESRIETATADGSASVHVVVGWRQECLALAQIACHDDLFQLGRAACNLARAYLAAGMASSAVPHAERAESLLLASAARTESADLLPTALLALADSLAARASSLARAAGAASAKKEGRADDTSARRRAAPPPQFRPARHHEARTPAGVPAATAAAAGAPGAISSRRDRSDASVLYKRAADAYHRALVAAHEVFGKGHVECCPVLRGWARMAIERSSDFALARKLLSRELEIRTADAGSTPSPAEADEIRQLKRELAGDLLLEANAITAVRLPPPVPSLAHAPGTCRPSAGWGQAGAGGGVQIAVCAAPQPEASNVASVRAGALRREAVALLDESVGGDGVSREGGQTTAAGAQLALKLAEACCELKAWGQAESALLTTISYHEETHGCCDRRTVELWLQVATLRMRQHGKYSQAAADLQHVVTMLTLLHGSHDERLITPCEQLCHAHLMLGQWTQARAALGRAHGLAAARYGADSPTAMRLAQVVRSIDEQMPEDARGDALLSEPDPDADIFTQADGEVAPGA